MDYEQKYNDAMARLELVVRTGVKLDPAYIFPELAESEDERIVTRLINLLHTGGYLEEPDRTKVLVWLEKQKEPKPAGWKPQPESLEALMYAIEGKWEMIKPTSYLSRRLEDLYEGLVNSYNVNEVYLDELPRVASAGDVEALKELKRKIDASMEQKEQKPVEWNLDQLKMFDDILTAIELDNCLSDGRRKELIRLLNVCRTNTQPKQKWSEEDKLNLQGIIDEIEANKNAAPSYDIPTYDRYLSWLKSLQPQPHWKPSEEQMGALNYAYCELFKREDVGHNILGPLQNLIDTLSKL